MNQSLLDNWQSEEGFEHLYKELYTRLYRYAFGLLSDEMQAEEVTQEVFLKLWQQKMSINISTNVQAYLYRAVHNMALNIFSHNKVKDKYKMYALSRTSQYAHSPEQTVYASELKIEIDKALNTIPEKCRTVFYLSRQEELSYREISEKLGISIKTVENQVSKALKILREALKDFLPILWLSLLMIEMF